MTLFELLPAIAAEILNVPENEISAKMQEYADKNKKPAGFYRQLSEDEISRAWSAARKDPQGFLRWAINGAIDVQMH